MVYHVVLSSFVLKSVQDKSRFFETTKKDVVRDEHNLWCTWLMPQYLCIFFNVVDFWWSYSTIFLLFYMLHVIIINRLHVIIFSPCHSMLGVNHLIDFELNQTIFFSYLSTFERLLVRFRLVAAPALCTISLLFGSLS